MAQPPGFIHSQFPSHVCKRTKSIYGLKQSPRAWFDTLSITLYSLGFTKIRAQSSLFCRFVGNQIVYLLVYVDDVIITDSTNA